MSKDSSTRLSVVFTDCPPGPDDRENRSRSSAAGITSQLFTRRSSATSLVSPAGRPCQDDHASDYDGAIVTSPQATSELAAPVQPACTSALAARVLEAPVLEAPVLEAPVLEAQPAPAASAPPG
jgi:hypothetical protein